MHGLLAIFKLFTSAAVHDIFLVIYLFFKYVTINSTVGMVNELDNSIQYFFANIVILEGLTAKKVQQKLSLHSD